MPLLPFRCLRPAGYPSVLANQFGAAVYAILASTPAAALPILRIRLVLHRIKPRQEPTPPLPPADVLN